MSMQDFEKATRIVQTNDDLADFVGPRPEALVAAAEQQLGVSFPPTYRRFLLEFGAGSFGATEIYGVIEAPFTGPIPDLVWYMQTLRQAHALPKTLVVVHSAGTGQEYCLDLRTLRQGEASLVGYWPGRDDDQVREEIAVDFGAFFLEQVQWEIEEL